MLRLAIYGKGGIGKSTTAANLAAAFSTLGLTVMQIGCDPKADSTSLLMHGRELTTVLDCLRSHPSSITLEQLVHPGYNGILCVEAGGPAPGMGCAGRGIISAFEKLAELGAFERFSPDVVLYDVLGDVVCGGFAMPMRRQYSDRVYIVTSGEKMSLFAAKNIGTALGSFRGGLYARLGGLILNRRSIENERERTESLAQELRSKIVADIPRSREITQGEELNRTVVEAFPDSELARKYIELAKQMISAAESASDAPDKT